MVLWLLRRRYYIVENCLHVMSEKISEKLIVSVIAGGAVAGVAAYYANGIASWFSSQLATMPMGLGALIGVLAVVIPVYAGVRHAFSHSKV